VTAFSTFTIDSDDPKISGEWYRQSDVDEELGRLEQALRRIINTPAEVEVDGNCAYCDAKRIAREALEAP